MSFYHVQNKRYNALYFEEFLSLLAFKNIKIFHTEEDFKNNVYTETILIGTNVRNSIRSIFKYDFYSYGYAFKVSYLSGTTEYTVFLNEDDNDDNENINEDDVENPLEQKKKEAVLAEYDSGLVVPYADLYSYNVEFYNVDGELLEPKTSNAGNPFMIRNPSVYIPTSGVLEGVPCMRVYPSSTINVLSGTNTMTDNVDNEKTVRLSTLRPYTIFISGLQMPNIENSTNALNFSSEAYEHTFYYTYN